MLLGRERSKALYPLGLKKKGGLCHVSTVIETRKYSKNFLHRERCVMGNPRWMNHSYDSSLTYSSVGPTTFLIFIAIKNVLEVRTKKMIITFRSCF